MVKRFSGKGTHRNRHTAQNEMHRWLKKGYIAEIRDIKIAGELAYKVYVKNPPELVYTTCEYCLKDAYCEEVKGIWVCKNCKSQI